MDKQVILRHTEYVKFCYLYNLTKNYVQRDRPKIKSQKKTLIIKIN